MIEKDVKLWIRQYKLISNDILIVFLRHSIVKHLRPLIVLSLAVIVAARQVFELSTSGHVTASFLELQWLPVCTYYGVSSSNCAALCTQFSMADVQLI